MFEIFQNVSKCFKMYCSWLYFTSGRTEKTAIPFFLQFRLLVSSTTLAYTKNHTRYSQYSSYCSKYGRWCNRILRTWLNLLLRAGVSVCFCLVSVCPVWSNCFDWLSVDEKTASRVVVIVVVVFVDNVLVLLSPKRKSNGHMWGLNGWTEVNS